MIRVCGLVLCIGVWAAESRGAAEESSADTPSVRHWLEYYTDEAASHELFLGGEETAELQLHRQALLHYTNELRTGQQHGAVFVWTHAGRPAVVGSVWSSVPQADSSVRSITTEFVSLSERPVSSQHEPRVGRRGQVPNWNFDRPGVTFRELPEAPVPAATPARRLIQARALARSFAATIVSSQLEERRPLRLQPQPIFRYASEEAGIVDGALFSYVLATDPELFLLLEVRNTDSGPQWYFALARFTNRPIHVSRGAQEEVWSCDVAKPYVGDQDYFLYWGVTTRPRSREQDDSSSE